eukprot:Partr_v1_DN27303_c0_g1_i1_m45930 putative chaperone protein
MFGRRVLSRSYRGFHQSIGRCAGQDPYNVLGVSKSSSQSDIKKAYFNMAKKYHPDTMKAASDSEKAKAKEKFMEIQQAYEILSDEQKRAHFDRFGSAPESGPGGPSGASSWGSQEADPAFAEEIFRQFFGGRAGSRASGDGRFSGFAGFPGFDFASQGPVAEPEAMPPFGDPRGGDITARLSLAFMEAIKGTKRSISYSAQAKCGSCSGSGMKLGASPRKCSSCGGSGEQIVSQGGFRIMMTCQACGGVGASIKNSDLCPPCSGRGLVNERKETTINIPAGVDSGERLRVSGKGHYGTRGQAGDLYITLDVQRPAAHESIFQRKGSDIVVEIPVPFYDALLGGDIQVPTIDGDIAKIKLAPGTQPGFTSTLSGRGVQKLMKSAGNRGDMLVKVKVIIPDLSKTPSNNLELRKLIERFKELNSSNLKAFDQETTPKPSNNEEGFLKKTFGKFMCDKEDDSKKKEA